MEELFDKELQGMVKFTDARPAIKEAAKKPAPKQQEKKAQRSKDVPMDADWQSVEGMPTYPNEGEPTYMERLQACAKWVMLFGGLSVLLFYWQQTGQMEASAAVPSMCVCTLMAGVGVGKHWKWR